MFSRISGNPNGQLPQADLADRALDDSGFLWWRGTVRWQIEKKLTRGKGRLIDVQAEPTLHQGADQDVAVTPQGDCWTKAAGQWGYDGSLGDNSQPIVKTETLVVSGNLTLPVVNDRVPLFDPIEKDKIIGCLKVYPWD